KRRARPVCGRVPSWSARDAPAGPARAGPGWVPGGGVCGLPRKRWLRNRACVSSPAMRGSGFRVFFRALIRLYGKRREFGAQGGFQLRRDRRILLEVLARVLLALTDPLVVVAVPGAGLVHQLGVHAHVDQFALAADAL